MAPSESAQSYSNHARFFPLFHFFAAPILIEEANDRLGGVRRA